MCNILPSLRCIAVRFLPLPLHTPDSRYAHKQNADERQTHIGIRSGAKCPTHRQGRPATSFSDGQSAENEKFHPHLAIPQQAVDLLIAEQKKHSRNPYLFPSPKTGTMYDPDAFRRTYDKILKAIGVEHIRLHNLRHTFATLSPRSGVDVKTLSGAFQPFPRVGQVVSLEETAKIKRLKKLRIAKENHRNQAIPTFFSGEPHLKSEPIADSISTSEIVCVPC